MTLAEIVQSVKTKYYNFGLKDKNIEKLANIVKTNMDAMGAIDDEQTVLATQVGALEPYLSVFQSEFDARRAQPQQQPQPQPKPQPEVQPVQTPQQQPTPQAQVPEGWDEVMKFFKEQKTKEQQKTSFETRTKLMDGVKGKISPNGQLDEGKLYKLFSMHADKFAEGADVEALTKDFQELYNQEASNAIPSNPFIPANSVPGATVADADKQAATKSMIDKFMTTRRV